MRNVRRVAVLLLPFVGPFVSFASADDQSCARAVASPSAPAATFFGSSSLPTRRDAYVGFRCSMCLPDGPPVPAPAAPASTPVVDADAAVGLWGGAIGQKIDGGVLDSFVIGIDKAADGVGYDALSRADVTMAKDGRASKVVVITRYTGKAKDGGVAFESTERKRTVDDGAPVTLTRAFLRATPKEGHLEARVGNDEEGYSDFTLVPKPRAADGASPTADAVRGAWGGVMSKTELSKTLSLTAMLVDVASEGPWVAAVTMNFTVHLESGDVPVVVKADYVGGKVDGSSVRWEKVAWHRTVTPTGQKTELDGNPLVLKVKADGGLDGTFEGDDGWPFTLARRGPAPASRPPPTPAGRNFEATVGQWGGEMHLAIDDGVVEALVIGIDKTGDGTFSAGSRGVYTVVDNAKKSVRIVIVGRYTGKVEGDKIVFHSTSRQTGLEDAKTLAETDPCVLEVTPEGGKITGRIGSDKNGWMTFTLSPRPK